MVTRGSLQRKLKRNTKIAVLKECRKHGVELGKHSPARRGGGYMASDFWMGGLTFGVKGKRRRGGKATDKKVCAGSL